MIEKTDKQGGESDNISINAESIKELWSKTYNTEGKPDWSHILPYYDDNVFFWDTVQKIEGQVVHIQTKPEVIEAWRSHATLHRQAGEKFDDIISGIEKMLDESGLEEITIPYTTRLWVAQLKA